MRIRKYHGSNVIKEKIRVTAASGQYARETAGQTSGEEFSSLPLPINSSTFDHQLREAVYLLRTTLSGVSYFQEAANFCTSEVGRVGLAQAS